MELRHIRTFLVLSKELHFGRTAQKLRVAQSAVSQTLRALEEELGVQLLARSKRSVTLTAAGASFVEYAERSLQELAEGAMVARRAALGHLGELRISFTLMSALTVLPRAVARFQREHPQVQVSLTPGGSVEQLEAIREGRCDVGFMAFKRDIEPLATLVVARAPLVAVLPSRHRLARRAKLELAELAEEPFIFLKQQSEPQIYEYFQSMCARAGFQPRVVMQVEHSEALLSFVAAGVGVSCVPSLVERLRVSGVTTVPLLPEIRGGMSAVWRREGLSPPAARFLEVLEAELAKSPHSRA
jgi:DNA-binding transcriptional LysR family regulator